MNNALIEQVAGVLQRYFDGHSVTVSADGNVVLNISRAEYDYQFGQLYLKVLELIEKHFPVRMEDIKVLFRTEDGTQEHIFRMWHSESQLAS